MRKAPLSIAIALLSACSGSSDAPNAVDRADTAPPGNEAAEALERAAIDSGAVVDTAKVSPIGLYRHSHEAGRDSLCIAPGENGRFRFGMEARFGEGIYCRGRGTARRVGNNVIFNFRRSTCLVIGEYQGDVIQMPGATDERCTDLCTERGSLEGVSFPRISYDLTSGGTVKDNEVRALCADD